MCAGVCVCIHTLGKDLQSLYILKGVHKLRNVMKTVGSICKGIYQQVCFGEMSLVTELYIDWADSA